MFMRSGYSAQTRSVRPSRGPSATQHHHGGPDVGLGLGDRARALDPEARRLALGLERRGVEVVEADAILLDGEVAGRVDRLAQAADPRAFGFLVHGDRPARVDDPVDLADVRRGRQAVDLVEGL